ncbi:MAG: YifB family Mg chelatase-like AAA ATPase [Planctomycetota bacterium]|nr:YifB family Mg chelatase-like AAA ATPase [Planctomycetota bacterium]
MPHKPSRIGSGVLRGVDAVPVTVEVRIGGPQGTPKVLGLADNGVREALFRILGAFSSQDLPMPRGVPTISLTPATIPKSGSGFDLPMALALGSAGGIVTIPPSLAALGEVSLGGDILPTPGIVAVALAAREQGWTDLLTAPSTARIAALVPGIRAFGAGTLREAFDWIRGELKLAPAEPPPPDRDELHPDLAEIRGHETPKRALMVAAAGRHNLLMVGPPGSGKSALAKRLPGILPPTSDTEALEILKIHTIHGSLLQPLGRRRPIRSPHHTSSVASLLGGGRDPRPGEVSLSQHGVLFLDELPEFRREVIEGLRQPLEDGHLSVGRVRQTVTMPADFLLVCTMNPCPCGYHGHGLRACTCSPAQRQRYRARVSGPMLDRLDLQVEVPNVAPETYTAPQDTAWSTEQIAQQVQVATERQQSRSAVPNARLREGDLEQAIGTAVDVHRTLETILRTYRLSGRSRVRLLRISRTLADLDDRDDVLSDDLLVAARLRGAIQGSGI